MKRLFPLFILASLSTFSIGQNQVDALRYSLTYPGGTARSVALGGAFGALGGDFYSASQNPAGLGVYRSSELTFTPELFYSKVNSRYYGNSDEDIKYNFNFNNIGYISSFDMGSHGIVGGSFAIGYNKLVNYNENILIEGTNTQSSLGDMFVESANYGEGSGPVGLDYLHPFTEGLFYDGEIMNIDNAGYYYLNEDIRDTLGNINIDQYNGVKRSGKINEWAIAMGFNYEHKLYFGATISILPLEYDETSSFRESDREGTGVEYFRYNETLSVSGTGITAKVGVIVKPVAPLRIGLAYHLPVSYYLSEKYSANLRSYRVSGIIDPIDEYGDLIDYASYEYRIVTPAKALGSIGLIVGKHALLSTEIEYINYAGMRLADGSDGYDFSDENEIVKDIYRKNFNAKAGVEFRIDKLYLRGGFGYYGSPYKMNEVNSNAYKLNYSGGIGIRDKSFFVDFALSYMTGEENLILYSSPYNANPVSAELESIKIKAMTTFGFRF